MVDKGEDTVNNLCFYRRISLYIIYTTLHIMGYLVSVDFFQGKQ